MRERIAIARYTLALLRRATWAAVRGRPGGFRGVIVAEVERLRLEVAIRLGKANGELAVVRLRTDLDRWGHE